MPIAVGIDAAQLLKDRRGMGRYVRSVLHQWLARHADRVKPTLLVPHAFPGLLEPRFQEQLKGQGIAIARRSEAKRLGLDVVWFPWNGMTWTTPLRSVVTLHDMWPFVSPALDARRRAREQRHYLEAAQRADRFIAVSSFTANEASTYLSIDPARIDVVAHGVDYVAAQGPRPARISGAEHYVLFVGENEPRKDLATLLGAAALLPERLARTTAVVVAGRSHGRPPQTNGGVRVELAGEVSDERLASLYAGAAALAFPSRYEGFGLPVLEAMRYGVPVVASSAAAIPEAGGDAALYFPPGDTAALARALTQVIEDGELARRLAESGRARAALMTNARCACQTLEVMERVARG